MRNIVKLIATQSANQERQIEIRNKDGVLLVVITNNEFDGISEKYNQEATITDNELSQIRTVLNNFDLFFANIVK